MLLILSVTGIFLSLFLIGFKARSYTPTIYLGLFFLFTNMYAFVQFVLLNSKSVFLVALLYTNFTVFNYLIGPMLFWYVRSVLTDNFRLKWNDLWHLMPTLIYLASAFPYIITPWSYKMQIAKEIVNDPGFLGNFEATILSDLLSNTIVYLSRPLHVLGYTILSMSLLKGYLKRREDATIFASQHFMTKWLFFFLGFQFILVISYLISIFKTFLFDSDVFFTINLLQISAATGLVGLLLSSFFFQSILYGLPRIPESDQN